MPERYTGRRIARPMSDLLPPMKIMRPDETIVPLSRETSIAFSAFGFTPRSLPRATSLPSLGSI